MAVHLSVTYAELTYTSETYSHKKEDSIAVIPANMTYATSV